MFIIALIHTYQKGVALRNTPVTGQEPKRTYSRGVEKSLMLKQYKMIGAMVPDEANAPVYR